MEENFEKVAYSQCYSIVNFLVEEGEIVVTQNFLDILEQRRDLGYQFDLNDSDSIELHPDTEKILTYVFLECVATSDEKNKIVNAVRTLKSIITDESEEVEEGSLLPIDVTRLKWSDRVKLKLKKILSLGIHMKNAGNANMEENLENVYNK